jgi:hypothetical protein
MHSPCALNFSTRSEQFQAFTSVRCQDLVTTFRIRVKPRVASSSFNTHRCSNICRKDSNSITMHGNTGTSSPLAIARSVCCRRGLPLRSEKLTTKGSSRRYPWIIFSGTWEYDVSNMRSVRRFERTKNGSIVTFQSMLPVRPNRSCNWKDVRFGRFRQGIKCSKTLSQPIESRLRLGSTGTVGGSEPSSCSSSWRDML